MRNRADGEQALPSPCAYVARRKSSCGASLDRVHLPLLHTPSGATSPNHRGGSSRISLARAFETLPSPEKAERQIKAAWPAPLPEPLPAVTGQVGVAGSSSIAAACDGDRANQLLEAYRESRVAGKEQMGQPKPPSTTPLPPIANIGSPAQTLSKQASTAPLTDDAAELAVGSKRPQAPRSCEGSAARGNRLLGRRESKAKICRQGAQHMLGHPAGDQQQECSPSGYTRNQKSKLTR